MAQTDGPYVTLATVETSPFDVEMKLFCIQASTVTTDLGSKLGVEFFCLCNNVALVGSSSCTGLFSPEN